MEFKCGDKVRMLVCENLNGIERFPVGSIGVISDIDPIPIEPYEVTINNVGYYYNKDEIELYTEEEKTYEKGMNDAWKIAKKLFQYSDDEREAIGLIRLQEALDTMTPQEVLAKIEEYEKSFIHTGDIVKNLITDKEYIVLDEQDGYAVRLDLSSHAYAARNKAWKKTGKFIDISSLKEAFEKSIVYEKNKEDV